MGCPSLIYTSHTANCNPNNPFQINLYFHPIHPIFHLLLGTSAKNAAQKHRNKKSQAEFFGAYVRCLWLSGNGLQEGVRTLQRAGSGVWTHVTDSTVRAVADSTTRRRTNESAKLVISAFLIFSRIFIYRIVVKATQETMQVEYKQSDLGSQNKNKRIR